MPTGSHMLEARQVPPRALSLALGLRMLLEIVDDFNCDISDSGILEKTVGASAGGCCIVGTC